MQLLFRIYALLTIIALSGCVQTPPFLASVHSGPASETPNPQPGNTTLVLTSNGRKHVLLDKVNGNRITGTTHLFTRAAEFEAGPNTLEVGVYHRMGEINYIKEMHAVIVHDFEAGNKYSITFSGNSPISGNFNLWSQAGRIAQIEAERSRKFVDLDNSDSGPAGTAANVGNDKRTPFTKEPESPNGLENVYIYRPDAAAAGIVDQRFSVNGETIAEIPRESYAVIQLPPGRHQLYTRADGSLISIGGVSSFFKFDVKPNQDHFIRWEPYIKKQTAYNIEFAADVRLVSESEAVKELNGFSKVELLAQQQ